MGELKRNRRTEQMGRGGLPHSSVFKRTNTRAWTYPNVDHEMYAREEIHPSDEELEELSERYSRGEESSGDGASKDDDQNQHGQKHDRRNELVANDGVSSTGDNENMAAGSQMSNERNDHRDRPRTG